MSEPPPARNSDATSQPGTTSAVGPGWAGRAQERFFGAPATVRGPVSGLYSGVIFGTVFGLSHRFGVFGDETSWRAVVTSGLLAGLAFAVVLGGLATARGRQRDALPKLASLTAHQRGEAVRATRRGPLPMDPAVRAAAVRLLSDATVRGGPRRGLWILGLFGTAAALQVILVVAFESTPLHWAVAALLVVGGLTGYRNTLREQRRLMQLSSTAF